MIRKICKWTEYEDQAGAYNVENGSQVSGNIPLSVLIQSMDHKIEKQEKDSHPVKKDQDPGISHEGTDPQKDYADYGKKRDFCGGNP